MSGLGVLWAIAGTGFGVAAVLTVIRIVRGPTILDRIIASDVLLVILTLVVGAEMVIDGHTRTIPIMLVLAGTAAFASVAVARFVSVQDRAAAPPPERVEEARSAVSKPTDPATSNEEETP